MSVSHWFRAPFRSCAAFHILILVAGLCGAYATSLSGHFIWDDNDLIVNNDFIHSPDGYRDVFLHDIAAGIGEQYYYYRPLQMLTYWVEYRLWGLWAPGYRAVSLLLHLMACLLLYRLVRGFAASSLTGLCAALLYGLHPVHTGAISYIAGRADPLAGVFLLVAISCHRKAVASGLRWPAIGAVAAYAAALLSREHAVVFIGVVGAAHVAWRERRGLPLLLLYLAITVGYGLLRKGLFPELVVDTSLGTLPERLPGFFVAFARYLRILIWPFPLQVDYGVVYFPWSDPRAIWGVALFLTFTLAAGGLLWRKPSIGWGVSWYLVALLPFANLYPLNAYMAEHWLYVPWMGLAWAIVIGARAIWKRAGSPPAGPRWALVAFLGMALATAAQNRVWREPIPFYKHMLRYSPDSVILYNRLGLALMEEERWEEAARAFERAVRIHLDFAPALHNLAVLHEQAGDDEAALDLYWRAVQSRPGQVKSWERLMGAVHRSGNRNLMADFVRQALPIHPQPELIEAWWRERQPGMLDPDRQSQSPGDDPSR